MVKGITRQVIVVQSPEPKLFEQAIFILREDAIGEGITDEMLLKEANKAVNHPKSKKKVPAAIWACAGAGGMGLAWILSNFL